MPTTRTEVLPIRAEGDVVMVRHEVRSWAAELRFGIVDQTKLTTAASELARNTLIYGKGGSVTLDALSGDRIGLRMTFQDRGPGIADLELAMKDGYTSGGGLGLGLSGSRRLMHEFAIQSQPGEGTTVTVAHYKR